jgi:hypothetical protein
MCTKSRVNGENRGIGLADPIRMGQINSAKLEGSEGKQSFPNEYDLPIPPYKPSPFYQSFGLSNDISISDLDF